MTSEDPASVLIVDDHPVFRLGVRFILERAGFTNLVEAETVEEARRMLRTEQPDLAVVDIMLSDGSGLVLAEEARILSPETRVLMMSMLDESIYAERSIRSGARGYLMKSKAPAELAGALRRIADGDVYLGEEAVRRLVLRTSGTPVETGDPLHALTARELEVLQLLGDGNRTAGIAQLLHLSPKTIETHVARIKRKLGLQSGAELSRFAIHWRLSQGMSG